MLRAASALLALAPAALASPTILGLANHSGSIGFFRVDIDLHTPTEYNMQWGANPAEYINPQSTVGPSCIDKFQDGFNLYAEDKLVHSFGFECVASDKCAHRLDNYMNGKVTLDADVIDFSEDCSSIAYANGSNAVTFAGPTFRTDFPQLFTVQNLTNNAGAVLADNDHDFLLWTVGDGFNMINKTDGKSVALSGHCEGQVVEMSWPWGWPTKDNLFVVITRTDNNTFVANRYDAVEQNCEQGYTFAFDDGWAGADSKNGLTLSWMDSIHALTVTTKDRFFYALAGQGPAVPTTVVDLTKELAAPASSIIGVKAWQY